MVTHHPLTSFCWDQKQIQVSMGGGRDQHFVSSVSVWRPRRRMKGAICSCISIWGMLRAVRSRQLTQRGRSDSVAWIRQIPQPCAAHWHFSAILGSPTPRTCMAVEKWLLCLSSFTFHLSFLSPLEGIVLISLFTSLPFFECNSFFPLPPNHKQNLSLLQQYSVLALCCSSAQCHTDSANLFCRCGARGVAWAHPGETSWCPSAVTSLSLRMESIWWQKEAP